MTLCSKSFSHLLATLDRNITLLTSVLSSPQNKEVCLIAISEFWRACRQQIIITGGRFMTSKLLDNISIINFLFSPKQTSNLSFGYTRDLIRNTINKTILRTQTAREELNTAQEMLGKVPSSDRSGDIPENKRVQDRTNSLNTILKQQNEFLVIVFQKLCMIITEHLNECESKKENPQNYWFKCTTGILKEIGRKYAKELIPCFSTLELLFTTDNLVLVNIFQQIKVISQS